MKRSIRKRITLIFLCLMTLMLLMIWIVNGWLLEPYYTDQKMRVMEAAYDEIDAAIMERVNAGEKIDDVMTEELENEWEIWKRTAEERRKSEDPDNPPKLDDETLAELQNSLTGKLRRYSEQNNLMIILVDSSTGKVLANFGRSSDFLAQKLQGYVLGQNENEETVLVQHENYTIERNNDRRSSGSYLESWGYFSDNNTLFLMQMPLVSIRESVSLMNRFIAYIGLAVLIAGGAVMYVVCRRVTDPIMKLATLSERMSNLDFDAKYEGSAEDEVGVLGRSMNTMSDRLKETIGELRTANAQLQKDIQEKIEIDDMRKEFISNVSHELKTPIALIQGYAEGLTEGMADDEESRNYYCEVIMDEANKMNKLVKQLLTLTALEFGNDTPVLEVFDISELIRDLMNSASILAEQKQAKITCSCPQGLFVEADEFKIEEVVTNYFNNALNHLDGGRIIRFTAAREGDRVKVSVFNTGEQIPEESIPNLWTKFYKVDKARTRAYGGSGIGLSIVKAIMDAHHQSCGVENRPDGVEFWFTLAAAPAPAESGEAGQREAAQQEPQA